MTNSWQPSARPTHTDDTDYVFRKFCCTSVKCMNSSDTFVAYILYNTKPSEKTALIQDSSDRIVVYILYNTKVSEKR
jgi:hypothetical protein